MRVPALEKGLPGKSLQGQADNTDSGSAEAKLPGAGGTIEGGSQCTRSFGQLLPWGHRTREASSDISRKV